MKLFSENDGGEDPVGDISKIEINDEYARRFEHNKKREDLQRFEELKKKGIVDSENEESSSEEEDDDNVVNYSSKNDLKFFDALIKVRNKDPILKEKEAKLFDDSDTDEDNNEINDNDDVSKKKKKKMYLKDVTAMHLLENGPEFEDVEENKKMSYKEEQEALRNEFLDAADKDDDGGELLKVKDGKEDEESEDGEYVKKLDEYFKEDEKLDENERFLKDYFRKKMWLAKDEGGGSKGLDIDDGFDVSEDEAALEKQEDYEREFNFRFQENAGDRVWAYSRTFDGVRKKENGRKVQRKNKEERMAQAETERREELKYLKNLKKKEMNEKIRKIREIAGFKEDDDCVLDERDLEEEFDPVEYDKKMKKAFDDSFYEAEDVDPEFGSDEEDGELEKPNFDAEDDLLGLPKGWDEKFGTGDGFLATRERTLKNKVANGGHDEQTNDDEDMDDDDEEEEEEEEEAEEEPIIEERKKRKRKTSKLEEELIKKELEEYYKLDYEDTIGDLKTRFKYRPVNKNTYGLKPKEILVVDDKELNQLIPLKKLATYREDDFVVPRNKIKEQKQRIRSLLKGESSYGPDNGSKRSRHDSDLLDNGSKRSKHDDGDAETEKPKSDVQNDGPEKLSRKQRRKMKQKDLALSTSRKIAYNMLQPKPKNKKKNKA
uniref:protein KRI1 homolog n=1 Tax=Erigeron canadensis TaxID=72917 RepID=UPI001CB91956|nr:protein KRI1 homolog [Erigeron canadensis]